MYYYFSKKFGILRKKNCPEDEKKCKCCDKIFPTREEAKLQHYINNSIDINFNELYTKMYEILETGVSISNENYKMSVIHKPFYYNSNSLLRLADIYFGFIATEDVNFKLTIGNTIFEYNLKENEFCPLVNKKYPLILCGIPYNEITVEPIDIIDKLEVIICALTTNYRLCTTCIVYEDINSYFISNKGIWCGKRNKIPKSEFITNIPPLKN